jgi:hypothetical protein
METRAGSSSYYEACGITYPEIRDEDDPKPKISESERPLQKPVC